MARAWTREMIPFLVVGVLLVIGIVLGGGMIARHISEIEGWITGLGTWGSIVFVGLFAVITSFLVPDSLLCIAAGAMFGIEGGILAVTAGTFLAAAIQFALARGFLHERIQRTLASRPSLAAIQRAVRRDELRLQFLLRLTPLNPATVSYLLGAAGVRFTGFLIACLASIPAHFVEVYFGHVGKHVANMAGGDRAAHFHDLVVVLVGFVLCITVMVMISKIARKAVMQAVKEVESESAAGDPKHPE